MKNEPESDHKENTLEKKGIPLRWILYVVLTYAFFQTLYIWWQVRGA
jgi:hypothetical protein